MATEFAPGSTGQGLAASLRRVAWDVAEVDLRHYFMRSSRVDLRLAARAMNGLSAASYNADILALAKQVNAQVMVTVKGSFITSETLAKLRAAGVRCVNYYPDFHFDHPGITPAALAQYDLIATTKSFQVDYLTAAHGAERTAFLHHAYNAEVHHRHYSGDIPYRWDISMIGNPSPQKARYMIAVAQAFPDCRIAALPWLAMAGQNMPLARHLRPMSLAIPSLAISLPARLRKAVSTSRCIWGRDHPAAGKMQSRPALFRYQQRVVSCSILTMKRCEHCTNRAARLMCSPRLKACVNGLAII